MGLRATRNPIAIRMVSRASSADLFGPAQAVTVVVPEPSEQITATAITVLARLELSAVRAVLAFLIGGCLVLKRGAHLGRLRIDRSIAALASYGRGRLSRGLLRRGRGRGLSRLGWSLFLFFAAAPGHADQACGTEESETHNLEAMATSYLFIHA